MKSLKDLTSLGDAKVGDAKPEEKAVPEVKVEAKPEVKADAKPEVKVEAKPEVKPDAKPEVKSKLNKLTESAAPATGDKAKGKGKRKATPDIFEGYMKLLSDGKPHLIQDLLKAFELPSSSNGREQLRKCNRVIESNTEIDYTVARVKIDTGIAFQLSANEK